MTTRPLLCLVTDRARLAAALGRSSNAARSLLLEQIEGAVAGGIDLVQIREPDLDARDLIRLVRDVAAIAAGTASRVIVNDRLDVALSAGAAGVHLRESSFRAVDARRLSPALVVGRSVHSAEAARRAGPVDYLIAGTVFPTASKPRQTLTLGIDGLADIRAAAGDVPVLAIGGISEAHVRAIVAAGASGMAAIGRFIPSGDTAEVAAAVQKAVENLRFTFDTVSTVS